MPSKKHLRVLRPLHVALLAWIAVSGAALTQQANGDAIDFNRDIRPILSENCFACHGNDEGHRKAGLRLDQRENAIKTSDGIAAIVPGKPDQSEAYVLISSSDVSERMPPKKSGKHLTPEQVSLIKTWIEQGAKYGRHWAFVPPTQAPLPAVKQSDWPRNAIDHFILAKLEARGLKPSQATDRYRLMRRVYLDIIGLPPSPAEVDAFVRDTSPDAYEKVVDRLLASPRFGERWAQMWLDLARYADTMGYEKDLPRNIWAYRDWVIDAFNRDLPFDQFTVEQLAGDRLAQPRNDQILATAFHRNTLTNQEGGTDDEEYRVLAVKDRVDTTMQVWMGLTMGCAKCHSHKYDPISQEDYYRLYALFNQTEDRDLGNDAPTLATPSPGLHATLAELEKEFKRLRVDADTISLRLAKQRSQWEAKHAASPSWVHVKPEQIKATAGTTLTLQPDLSVLASGKSPDRDSYTIESDVAAGQYAGIRIEALTHPSLGRQGPGRNAKDPNFVINEFVVQLQSDALNGAFKRIGLQNARADYSQKGWPVGGAIDGDPKTGWAISSQFSKPHTAVFAFKTPLNLKQIARLRIQIDQNYGNRLTLGRFRVSLTNHDPKTVPLLDDDLSRILRTVPEKRGDEDKFQLSRRFLAEQASSHADAKKWTERIADIERQRMAVKSQVPATPIMRELPKNRHRVTRIHKRGNFLDQGDVAKPGLPTAFGPLPENARLDRLGVANWLVHPDNPLTARVQVNRIWARLFGTGIVLTEEDFGNQGATPSHPRLLDYLAVEFVKRKWSTKQIIRFMVTSATYRQSSNVSKASFEVDPDNRWLARGPRFRLEAESVRDQALASAGILSDKMFGPSVMPPQPDGIWKITYSGSKWVNATGEDRYRRGLYTFWRRTSPYPSMLTFDAGSREVCIVRRIRTNTPLQSLVTLNDPVFVEAAGGIAKRVLTEGGKTDADRMAYAFRLVAVRLPNSNERDRLLKLYNTAVQHFADAPQDAQALINATRLPLPDGATQQQFSAWIVVGNLLLNLDEVLSKG